MIKVLLIHSTTQVGGLTKVMFNICQGLQGKGVHFYLLLLSKQHPHHTDKDFKDLGVTIIQAPDNLNALTSIKFVAGQVAKIRPQLIHTHGLRGCVYANLVNAHLPHISTLHGKMFTNYIYDFGPLKGVLSAIVHGIAFTGASVQTVVSKTLLKDWAVKPTAHVIYNGVDTHKLFSVANPEKQQIRALLQIPTDAKVLVYVGNISKLKSVFTLLDAFKLVVDKHPTMLLYFIGKGECLEELSQQAKNHPQIKLMGYQSNVPLWLQAADVYVSPSLTEGFPNAALEALACGLQMVLSDIPAHQEVASIAGVTCTYFKTQDASQLALKLEEVAQITAPMTLPSDISLDNMCEAYLKLYREVLA